MIISTSTLSAPLRRPPDSLAPEPYHHLHCHPSDIMVIELDQHDFTILTICRHCHREERWVLSGEMVLCEPGRCPKEAQP